jgi:hypothetical protein
MLDSESDNTKKWHGKRWLFGVILPLIILSLIFAMTRHLCAVRPVPGARPALTGQWVGMHSDPLRHRSLPLEVFILKRGAFNVGWVAGSGGGGFGGLLKGLEIDSDRVSFNTFRRTSWGGETREYVLQRRGDFMHGYFVLRGKAVTCEVSLRRVNAYAPVSRRVNRRMKGRL